MEKESNQWQNHMIASIEEKTADIPGNKKAFLDGDLLKRLINKVPALVKSESELEAFQNRIEGILEDMPENSGFKLREIQPYRNRINSLKMYLKGKYQLVTKGYYVSIFLPIGIALGMPFGVLLDNIALGQAFGLPVGLMIGALLDARAKKEGRII